MIKPLLFAALFCAGALSAPAQNIRDHYVSMTQQDGTIYHTMPCTLFENAVAGDLAFDITYKTGLGGSATINFTYSAERTMPADSVCFVAGRTTMRGGVSKLYIAPDKKRWNHRYSFSTPFVPLCTFFDETAIPEVTVYCGGKPLVFRAKRSAWKSYAPVGYKIFEMIRINEKQ